MNGTYAWGMCRKGGPSEGCTLPASFGVGRDGVAWHIIRVRAGFKHEGHGAMQKACNF